MAADYGGVEMNATSHARQHLELPNLPRLALDFHRLRRGSALHPPQRRIGSAGDSVATHLHHRRPPFSDTELI